MTLFRLRSFHTYPPQYLALLSFIDTKLFLCQTAFLRYLLMLSLKCISGVQRSGFPYRSLSQSFQDVWSIPPVTEFSVHVFPGLDSRPGFSLIPASAASSAGVEFLFWG